MKTYSYSEEKIQNVIARIRPVDEKAMQFAAKRWNSIAKPLHGMGRLEDLVIALAGIQRTDRVCIDKKALVVMCADNGVVEEGVTQTGQEVTAVVAGNFRGGKTTAALLCEAAGADLFPIDAGMAVDVPLTDRRKTLYGTANMAKGPAMAREDACAAILSGMEIAAEMKEKGYQILASGEMGIGNTTTSAAVTSVLLGMPPEETAGRGAGLSDQGLLHKIEVIRQAIAVNRPDPGDPLDVLARVGGLDIAALTGLFLGGAADGVPVVADGVISCTAALLAVRIAPACREYILPSHLSDEPAAQILLKALHMEPVINAGMHLGEGTGAVALFPLLEMALKVYNQMSTFEGIEIEPYKEFTV